MATLAELERALVAADAAGNTEDARALAQAIAAQRQPKAQPTPERAPRATDNMSGLDRFRAGIGKSLVDTGTGLAQVALRNLTPQVPDFITRAGDRVEQAIGSPTYSNARRAVFGAYNAPRQGLERKVAERREIDKDLMDTGAGLAGNVVGTLAQLAAPGIAARGTATAPLLLPTSVRGSVAQGAVFGSAQPVASQDEVLENAGWGAFGGGAGSVIPAAGGLIARTAKRAAAPFTQRGTEEAAARVIRGFAEDPARLVRNPSSVPGVQRTLAEETLDPGIAQLQRAVSAQKGAPFDSLRRGNNAARVGAIRQFAGDEADIAAAEAARDAAAVPLLQRAETVTGVDTQPVRDYVQQAIDANATRPTVRNAVRDVQAALNEAGDDVSSLYNLRKYIDDLLQGRVGGEQGYARAASRELQGVKGALDQQLESASPEFGQYLDLYRSGSAPINRMQAGQELLRRSRSSNNDPVTDLEVLTPAAFSRSARNLDAVAAGGTGFGKAKASTVFEPSDLATIKNVNDDLARQAFADTAGRGSGSDTFQKLATNGDILGAVQELGVNIPGSGIIRMLGSKGRERVNAKLVEILTDPARAQDVLRRTSASDRKVIQGVLTAMGGESGTALAVGSSN